MRVACGTFTLTPEEGRALMAAANKAREDRAARMPDDTAAIRQAFEAWQRLTETGWRDATYAPRDHSALELIEPGSPGIHRGYRDTEGRFWIMDDDTWPSRPMLFRPSAGA